MLRHPLLQTYFCWLMSLFLALQPITVAFAASHEYRIPFRSGGGEAQLLIEPDPVNFGEVAQFQVGRQPVSLINAGYAPATITHITADAPFSVEPNRCSTVEGGRSCELMVQVMPISSSGMSAGWLRVTDSSGTEHRAQLLSANAGLLTDIELSDWGWNFGYWKMAETSPTKQLNVKNVGQTPVTITQLYLKEGEINEFNMTHTCGVALQPGNECVVTVDFTPNVLGERTGAFRVKADDGRLRDVWMLGYGSLTGEEPSERDAGLSLASILDFGEEQANGPVATKTVLVANAGPEPITLSEISLNQDGDSEFTVSHACLGELVAFQTCPIQVTFAPTAIQSYEASLAVSTATDSRSMQILGKGTPSMAGAHLVADVTAIDFGETTYNAYVERDVVITNVGTDPTQIQQAYATNPENFIVSRSSCYSLLAPEASCSLTVQFTARTVERSNGDLFIIASAGKSLTIPLTGNVPTGILSLSESRLAFAPVPVGESATRHLEATNIGSAPLMLVGVGLEAAHSDFALSNNCATPLNTNESCTIVVKFEPWLGTDPWKTASEATLVIASNDHVNPFVDVPLRGAGINGTLEFEPASHTFKNLLVGEVESTDFTLVNNGNGGVRLRGVTVPNGTHDCPALLLKGEHCSMTTTYQPVKSEAYRNEIVATALFEELAIVNSSQVRRNYTRTAQLRGAGFTLDDAILITPEPVNFGTLPALVSKAVNVTLTNQVTHTLLLGTPTIVGAEASDFNVAQSTCAMTLAGGASCEMTLSVESLTEGEKTAQLVIPVNNGDGHARAGLFATIDGFKPLPAIVVEPTSLEFNGISVGAISAEQSVTIRNEGLGALTLSMREANAGPSPFNLTNRCPSELVSGASCTVGVRFEPTTDGTAQTSYVVNSNDPQRSSIAVDVVGNSAMSELVATPSPVEFEEQAMAATSSTSVTLRNQGQGIAYLDSILVDSNLSNAFSAESFCSATLQPGQECMILVRFTVKHAGQHEARLQIRSKKRPTISVPLSGLGPAAQATLTPQVISFPQTAVGTTSSSRQLTLTNIGTTPLPIQRIDIEHGADRFGLSHSCPVSLPASQRCYINVSFTPSMIGFQEGGVVVRSGNVDGPLRTALSGTGLSTDIHISPSRLDFGQTMPGESRTRYVEVTNIGDVPAVIHAIGVQNTTNFSSTNTCGGPLAAGEVCRINVTAAHNLKSLTAQEILSRLVLTGSFGLAEVELKMTALGFGISHIVPSTAAVSGGTPVTIFGSGFTADSRVVVAGVEAQSVRVNSQQQLYVITPANPAGFADVTVLTANNSQSTTKRNGLFYVDVPEITLVNPNEGSIEGGWIAQLTGNHFHSDMKVTVDGVSVSNLEVLTPTSALITIPPRKEVKEGWVALAITSVGGSTSLPQGINYLIPTDTVEWEASDGDYGSVSRGAAFSRMFILRNKGSFAVTVNRILVTPSVSGAFSIGTEGTCSRSTNAKLNAGRSCTVQVYSHGVGSGPVTASLDAILSIPAVTVTKALSALVEEADFVLSSQAQRPNPVSGAFPRVAAMAEGGGTNSIVYKTVYLVNTNLTAGSKPQTPVVSIEGPEAEMFKIVEVYKANRNGSRMALTTVTYDEARKLATGAEVDEGHQSYPHLAVQVSYQPTRKGEFNAQLNVDFNGNSRAQLPLYGEADWYSYVEISGSSSRTSIVEPNGDFGTFSFKESHPELSGELSRSYYLVATEFLGKPARVNRIRIEGPNADSFIITSHTGYSSARDTLLPNRDTRPTNMTFTSSASVTVKFKPTQLGIQEAVLIVEHDGDNRQISSVPLRGEGVYDTHIEVSGGAGIIPIPAVPETGVEGTRYLTTYLRNVGTHGSVDFKDVQIIGSSAFTLYSSGLASKNGTSVTGRKYAPVGSRYEPLGLSGAKAETTGYTDLTLAFKFTPLQAGTHTATVMVWHDALGGYSMFEVEGFAKGSEAGLANSGTGTISLTTGMPAASFNSASPEFNGTSARTVFVRNTNGYYRVSVTRARIVGPDAAAYKVTGYTGNPFGFIPSNDVFTPGMTQSTTTAPISLQLEFSPLRAGAHEAYLEVYHDGANESPLTLDIEASGDWNARIPETLPDVKFNDIYSHTTSNATSRLVSVSHTGRNGNVRYTGIKVEGDEEISVNYVQLNNSGAGERVNNPGLSNELSFNLLSDELGGSRVGVTLSFSFNAQQSIGEKAATVTLYHSGNEQGFSTFNLTGLVRRTAGVVLSTDPNVSKSAPRALNSFTAAPGNSSSLQTIYVHTTGILGKVTFSAYELVGSSAFHLTSTHTSGRRTNSVRDRDGYWTNQCLLAEQGNKISRIGTRSGTISYPMRNLDSMLCTVYGLYYPAAQYNTSVGFDLRFSPETLGEHSGTLIIYHDGNDEGFTEIPLSGFAQ